MLIRFALSLRLDSAPPRLSCLGSSVLPWVCCLCFSSALLPFMHLCIPSTLWFQPPQCCTHAYTSISDIPSPIPVFHVPHSFQPAVIQQVPPIPLFKVEQPPSTTFVFHVLPHRLYAILSTHSKRTERKCR